jgi:hypothetical protein
MSAPSSTGLDRRVFVQSAVAITALAGVSPARSENLGYIDSHSHVNAGVKMHRLAGVKMHHG